MTSFYIVDQSLVNRGGHHYDYTTCIAEAATSMGFDTVILANQKLDALTQFPNARLDRPFKNTVYQRDSYLAGLRHLKRAKSDLLNQPTKTGAHWSQFKTNFCQRKLHQRRDRVINQFAKDCERAFSDVSFSEYDHVFLTTVSELELVGLAIYLSSNPATLPPTWHLQFHFNLFEGRTPEYASQTAVQRLTRECFASALNRLSYHRVRSYTTSQPLADQYNRLGVDKLASLPYPVAPEFALPAHALHDRQPHFANQNRKATVKQTSKNEALSANEKLPATTPDFLSPNDSGINQPIQARATGGALRFTCPGQIRREKGCVEYLQPLVNDLWESHLASGKVKIAVQRPRRKKFRKEKIELCVPPSNNGSSWSTDAIEYFDHPLGRADYIDFLKNTDCGLLFYDSRTYYSRRAGVLGELLSAGKPLIVSAGSWLARQIAEPNFQYGENLCHDAESTRVLRIEDVEYAGTNVPAAAGVVSFDQNRHPFKFSFNRQPQEQMLLLSFAWKFPKEEGTFAKIELTQKNGLGETFDTGHQIVGHRQTDRNPNCLFRLQNDAETVEVTFSNAYSSSTASFKDIQIELLTMPSVDASSTIPTSSVGIIAADVQQLTSAVTEMVLHYDHYKTTAESFAVHWFAMHNPVRTVAHLLASHE